MFLVKGYVVVEVSGFNTKKHFEGFVNKVFYPTDDTVRIQGINIPATQIRSVIEVFTATNETLDIAELMGLVTRKRQYIKRKVKPVQVDHVKLFAETYMQALDDLQVEFGVMQRCRKLPDYEIIDEFVKSCEWQMSVLQQSITSGRATATVINDYMCCIERFYISARKKINGAPTVKSLIEAWERA